ncbi:ferredoxin-NADP reductase [Natronospira proteinivora]|uniref:Ferredoxin-NADP reductase n=1 Tax=Natronospira proteinivora TaxID=1807133 RepID=A0ABT1G7X7_9GAMM|nr:FAD-binding oxidoreductase [Natronospira proteinivora]MCP1727152.1 ferredoxin-NADP reductase [Natronospira proteinivora]
MAIKKFQLVLQSTRMITPRVKELTFTRADGEVIDYIPGQFLTMHMPHENDMLRRSYSISSIPEEAEATAISIAVTHVDGGRATEKLFSMEHGDSVDAVGPFGRFILRDDPPCRYLLIGTGTGVTPYRAMLPELERRIDLEDFKVELFLGVRNPEELLYGGDFRHFAEKHDGFNFHAVYSRVMPEQPSAFDHKGYVQDQLDTVNPDPERDIVYLCGNPEMIDLAATRLKEAGFPVQNIRREKYISSN